MDRGAEEIARRSRGTPRIANRLLRRVRDFAQVRGDGRLTEESRAAGAHLFEVDQRGLDKLDLSILSTLVHKFAGGPVGLSTLAAAVGEETETVEDVYEPYLLQLGFINEPSGAGWPPSVPSGTSVWSGRARSSSPERLVRAKR